MKKILFALLAVSVCACNSMTGTPTPAATAKAAANCKDWNYKPGTTAYTNCVSKMSDVH